MTKPMDVNNCTCFNLRKAARVVTHQYDEILKPSGLRSTQFSLLTCLCSTGHVRDKDTEAAAERIGSVLQGLLGDLSPEMPEQELIASLTRPIRSSANTLCKSVDQSIKSDKFGQRTSLIKLQGGRS